MIFFLFIRMFNKSSASLLLNHQFNNELKFGSDDLVKPFETKLTNDIENKFVFFKEQNTKKQEELEVRLNHSRYHT